MQLPSSEQSTSFKEMKAEVEGENAEFLACIAECYLVACLLFFTVYFINFNHLFRKLV